MLRYCTQVPDWACVWFFSLLFCSRQIKIEAAMCILVHGLDMEIIFPICRINCCLWHGCLGLVALIALFLCYHNDVHQFD
uniref:Uncharacterized protein n=1 Tax=Rhizophora mucronata TaxID=61149 RepID=A0A2P2QC10_RHIMU